MTTRCARIAGLAALLLASAAGRPASAQPVGPEFRVNTYTSGDQDHPIVAMDSGGNFVVSFRSHGPDGALNGPRAQRYDAGGAPLGGEFSARSGGYYFTNGGVASASDSAGNFVVVWSDATVPGDDQLGLFGQRFAAAGAPIGGIFHVNTYTTGDQSQPRVAMDGSGDFVVVWQSSGEDGDGDGVFARRFAPDATPLGGAFRVNTYTTGNQTKPRVSMSSSGDFVVVWQSTNGDPLFDVYGQRYAASGTALGSEFRVNTYTGGLGYSGEPAVASAPTGGFVVVWRSTYGVSGSGEDILARSFSAAGVPLASEFRVNATTSTYGDDAAIAPLGSTGFVVTWLGGGKDKLVFGRVLSTLGSPLGTEFRVNTYTSSQNFATAVAGDGGRRFVVAWVNGTEDGSLNGVYAQRFRALANGDVNGDGAVDVLDVFYLINALFAGGAQPVGPADVNGDLAVDVLDVFYLINALFAGGAAPV